MVPLHLHHAIVKEVEPTRILGMMNILQKIRLNLYIKG